MRGYGHHIGPHVGKKIEIGMVRQQRLYNFRMLLRNSPHQRRLPSRAVRIRIRAFGKQQFDDFGIAGARGHH